MSSRMHCGPLRVDEHTGTPDSPAAAGATGATGRPTPARSADRAGLAEDPWGTAPTRRPPSRGLRRMLAPLA